MQPTTALKMGVFRVPSCSENLRFGNSKQSEWVWSLSRLSLPNSSTQHDHNSSPRVLVQVLTAIVQLYPWCLVMSGSLKLISTLAPSVYCNYPLAYNIYNLEFHAIYGLPLNLSFCCLPDHLQCLLVTICDAIINGLFLFKICMLQSIVMVYKHWDSITVHIHHYIFIHLLSHLCWAGLALST